MKFLPLAIVALFIFSCDPYEKPPTPDPSITPPEWIRGIWTHTDSTNYTENLIISEDDIIHERIKNSSKTTVSYVDSCKDNNIVVEQKIKYNTYYNLKFEDENGNINHFYLAKIAGNKIRVINETSPTPKTYFLE